MRTNRTFSTLISFCLAVSTGLHSQTNGHSCLSSLKTLLLAGLVAIGFCLGLRAQTPTNDPNKVDDDGDGLIEVWSLTDLDNMRHNLAGTGYRTAEPDWNGADNTFDNADDEVVIWEANRNYAPGNTTGCPDKDHDNDANTAAVPTCHGYELMVDLDFRDASAEGYQKKWVALNNADPTAQGASIVASADGQNPGWPPIGDGSNAFTGNLEGNDHVIKNLYMNISAASGYVYAGLFGHAEGATIQNVGLTGEHMSLRATNTGVFTSYAYAGGLVGRADGSSGKIVNCYVTGDISTSAAFRSFTGGLAGTGATTMLHCYATGDVSASISAFTAYVGGLAGGVARDSIIKKCYATGDVFAVGTGTGSAVVSGLVGDRSNIHRIINCYTTGDVSAIVPASRLSSTKIAGVSHFNWDTRIYPDRYGAPEAIRNSYYSGALTKGTSKASATAVSTEGMVVGEYKTLADIKALTAQSAGWSTDDWDFGDNTQLPTLKKYKEENGSQVEGELMCGQSAAHVQCAAPAPRQPSTPPVTTTDPDDSKVDNDGDGLIEIWNLTQLNHMRHNLAGTGYRTTEPDWNGADNTFDNADDEVVVWKANRNYAPGNTSGCPSKDHDNDANTAAVPTCHGYELMADLDFRDASAEGYQKKWVALNNADPTAQGASIVASADGKNPGWPPIGDGSRINPRGSGSGYNRRIFTGSFEGNDHTIKNLYININLSALSDIIVYAGLFGSADGATMQNVGLTGEHMSVRASNANPINAFGNSYAGGLVGEAGGSGSKIVNCYATGIVSNYGSGKSYTGGLAGWGAGVVTNCYATGNVSATDGSFVPPVGGLLGIARTHSTIKNCYATGDVSVTITKGVNFSIGGLIGNGVQSVKIINCYTTGDVSAITPRPSGDLSISGISDLGVDIAVVGPGDATSSSKMRNCYYSGLVKKGTSATIATAPAISTAGRRTGVYTKR